MVVEFHILFYFKFPLGTCTDAIITLESCALDAEFQAFHSQIESNFFTLQVPTEIGVWGVKGAQ